MDSYLADLQRLNSIPTVGFQAPANRQIYFPFAAGLLPAGGFSRATLRWTDDRQRKHAARAIS